jgi:hypothetical protein
VLRVEAAVALRVLRSEPQSASSKATWNLQKYILEPLEGEYFFVMRRRNSRPNVVVDDAIHDDDDENDTRENSSNFQNNYAGLHQLRPDDNGEAIVRNIASFMTLSDAASLASMTGHLNDVTPADSWVVGMGMNDESWSLATPETPALVAVSPGGTPLLRPAQTSSSGANNNNNNYSNSIPTTTTDTDCEEDDESEYIQRLLQEKRRKWAKDKLATAVFLHPRSLRSFCLEAYAAAQEIRRNQQQMSRADPETWIEPSKPNQKKRRAYDGRLLFVHDLIDFLFHNVPLSVLLDVMEAVGGLSLDTTFAAFRVTCSSINGLVNALVYAVHLAWDTIIGFIRNPFKLLETIISLQFDAMGKTSEVLVSGIQSVADGVESASSIALHKLSAANLSARGGSSSSLAMGGGGGNLLRGRKSHNSTFNKRLLQKMSTINDAARVVSYMESGDDTGGLTRHNLSRTKRMMHYSVSLRPFVATVAVQPEDTKIWGQMPLPTYGQDPLAAGTSPDTHTDGSSVRSNRNSPELSPVICSPQSFPPTPHSRQMVLARGSQFADDVVFLARDRLRIHDGMDSKDERTREMSRALREGKRLAIFDGNGANGIELTCGQHIATKVGSMHYASTRSMVPVLRNCYVYFEITVMPRSPFDPLAQAPPLTLSIGLSTIEMPPNTLVGAWQGSIGLCTTGQIFVAGQWCSPHDPSASAYTNSSTVGCLVLLDDSSAFETWDGVMVHSSVTFNINGQLVPPPASTLPIPGAATFSSSPHDGNRSQKLSSSQLSRSPFDQDGYIGSSPPLVIPPVSISKKVSPHATQTLLVPASEELYPTVTLQTHSAAVMSRFSAEDVICNSRERIGAPPGITVYAVDGTIIYGSELFCN